MPNANIKTGVSFGYIASNVLDSDLVNDLLRGNSVSEFQDHAWEDFKKEAVATYRQENDDCEDMEDSEIWDKIEMDCDSGDMEADVSGIYEGVHYQTSWLGGALNFFIFESPVMTDCARRASPCVPGAGILDTLDGDVSSYDVPADWRRSDI